MKTLIFLALIALGLQSEAHADFDLTCESNGGQTRSCPINGNFNRVQLRTQLSRASCYEGSSWGTSPGAVWVANGCRATFRVVQDNNNYDSHGNRYSSAESSDNGKAAAVAAAVIIGAVAIAASNSNKNQGRYDSYPDYGHYPSDYRSLTCESRDNKRNRCAAPIGRRDVQMTRRMSKSDCRFGRDWDFDSSAVYVWNGCRAEFTIH